MINHTYKFVYLHIPKTGGMSIGSTLNYLTGVDERYEGFKIHHDDLTQDILENYFVFTFVRNPWDRLYSQYKFRNFIHTQYSFDYFANNHSDVFHTQFNVENIENIPKRLDMTNMKVRSDWYAEFVHLPSQYQYIHGRYNDGLDKLPYINYIGRFENLQSDFNKVCKLLGLSKAKLPYKNEANPFAIKRNYREVYNSDTIETVKRTFIDDVKYFNYEF